MSSILISPADAQTNLARQLDQLNVRIFSWPELRIDGPQSYSALDEALENLFGYDWLILKNETAAEYFLRRFEVSHEAPELDNLKTLAVGERASHSLSESSVH